MAIAVFLAVFTATASALPSGFLLGDLSIALEKQKYALGETVNATILVFNGEQTPLAEAIVIVEIVRGKEYYSPTQISDADNVFFEQKITGISLRPGEQKEIKFSYTLPKDIANGAYRIDAYFKNKISNIVGIPNIFGAPRNLQFTVDDGTNCAATANCVSGNDWPNLQILRTKTEFNGATGPIGPATEPNSVVKGKVFIKNNSSKKATGKKLFVTLCEWDDTACQNEELTKPIEKTIAIDSIEANSEKEIDVELTAPKRPSAYAIRLELKDSEKTESLYRSRIVVVGTTSKVRKISASDFEFNANENAKIRVMLGPSPDHYNNPAFTGFELKLSVKDLQDNSTIFLGSEQIAEVKENYPEKEFSFAVQKATGHFQACAWTEKNGTVFDKECLEFDASKFSKPEKEPQIKVSWNYDYAEETLAIEFCNEPKEKPLNGEYFLLELGTTKANALAQGTLEGNNCLQEKISAGLGSFELHLLDYNTKRPSTIPIIVKPLEKNNFSEKNCAEMNGKECAWAEQCNADTIATKDSQKCCLGSCTKAVSAEDKIFGISYWQITAIIMIVLLLVFGWQVRKE